MKKGARREVAALAALLLIVAAALLVARIHASREPSAAPFSDLGAAVEATVDVGYKRGAESYLLIQVEERSAVVPLLSEGTVRVGQAGGEVNAVRVGPNSFFMESANCDNQDCVHQGTVTLDNRARRVMTNFVICLPNRVVLEMMDAGEAAAYVESSGVEMR